MEDQELLRRLEHLENKQWASKVLAEVRAQMKDFEYQIVLKTQEEEFVNAIREFSLAGYIILPGTTLLQSGTFVVLMRRDRAR